MPMPTMDPTSRKRPLSYDPVADEYITYDDIVLGEKQPVPLDELTDDELKKLVLERWRALPAEQGSQAISGPLYTRDDVIRAIEEDAPFGKMTVQAEVAYLKYLLSEIAAGRG